MIVSHPGPVYPPWKVHLSLILLVFQNSSLILLMRYSRTIPGPLYSSSTAVLMGEVVKILISLGILRWETDSWKETVLLVGQIIAAHWRELRKLFIPAALYTVQNNLLYYAVSNLEAAVYQVTYQLKILTTAAFSVWILGKRLNRAQLLALAILMVGVILVQFQPATKSTGGERTQHVFLGLCAVLLSCFSSGFAGVYLEKQFKSQNISHSVKNIVLATFSIVFSIGALYFEEEQSVFRNGFFYGYTVYTWLIILNSAAGGLLVSSVMKMADNIRKGFATSISIVVSSVIAIGLFGFQPSLLFFVGAVLVVGATYLYNINEGVKPFFPLPGIPLEKV